MTARDIVGGLSKAAVSAARHPVETAEQAIGVARGMVSMGAAAADRLLRQDRGAARPEIEVTEPQPGDQPAATEPGGEPASEAVVEAPREPQVVLAEPAPPMEPPIDIVGQVLAAEAEEQEVHPMTEPKAASRDEEHGEAALQRAEADEIAEEVAEAFPGGDLDVETPVGTTGADVGHNPDTAEADLQQPGTEPLMDPSLTKAVKSESDVLRRASQGGAD